MSIVPMRSPILRRETVAALSIIICEGYLNPFSFERDIEIRNDGVLYKSVVTRNTVKEGQSAKISTCNN